MDFDSIATIAIPLIVAQVVAYFATMRTAGKAIDDKVNMLDRTLNDRLNIQDKGLRMEIATLSNALVTRISDNAIRIEQGYGRIGTLESMFDMTRARREVREASDYLHKPHKGEEEMDRLLEGLEDNTLTHNERAELEIKLISHIVSTLPDGGQRDLLRALYNRDTPYAIMPAEPEGKAPDQTKAERRIEDKEAIKESVKEIAVEAVKETVVPGSIQEGTP